MILETIEIVNSLPLVDIATSAVAPVEVALQCAAR
jgi:hypothetical protein